MELPFFLQNRKDISGERHTAVHPQTETMASSQHKHTCLVLDTHCILDLAFYSYQIYIKDHMGMVAHADPRKRPIQVEKRDQAWSVAPWFSPVIPIPFLLLRASGDVFMKACEHPGYMCTSYGTPEDLSCFSNDLAAVTSENPTKLSRSPK